jgi:hypothetical protein
MYSFHKWVVNALRRYASARREAAAGGIHVDSTKAMVIAAFLAAFALVVYGQRCGLVVQQLLNSVETHSL